MALTAYSIDSYGTTYEYHTTRSPLDRLTTHPCSETVTLHPALPYTRTHAPETPYRRISLTDSMFTPPPENTRRDAL